ncbi:MAG: YggT family protein [Treponema sp.]|nr:YggT family protein [Treponema sp.]MCL2252390.1 YggT family protein [Treponema sp.]
MQAVFSLLASLVGVYSLLIIARFIMSWFSQSVPGKISNFLIKTTDPYLDWWKNRVSLRLGPFDLSVIFAFVSLSLVQTIFHMLAASQRITIGFLLAIILTALWSIVSFIAGFCLVVIILRGFAYLTKRNTVGRFWGTVDSISQPILYRMNRLIYGNRTGNFLNGMIISSVILLGVIIAGKYLVAFLAGLLRSLPI